MKKNLSHHFDWSIDSLRQAHLHRLHNMDNFPVMQNIEIIDKHEKDGKLHILRRIDIASEIPDIIKTIAAGKLEDFREELVFDADGHTESFEIFLNPYRHKFHIKGQSKYHAIAPDKTRRDTWFQVELDMLFMGPVKSVIARNYSEGMQREYEDMVKLLASGVPG